MVLELSTALSLSAMGAHKTGAGRDVTVFLTHCNPIARSS